MMNYPMALRRLSLASLCAASVLLSACTPSTPQGAQADAVAQCMVAHADAPLLRAMGAAYAVDGAMPLTRGQTWACDSNRMNTVLLDSSYKRALAPALAQALVRNATAREGVYGAASGLALDAGQRQMLGQLGGFLDEGRRAGAQVVACQAMAPEAVHFMSQLDAPFATAVIGARMGVSEPRMAQALSQTLAERVDLMTADSDEASSLLACDKDNGEARYRAHAVQLQLFADGKHPWAPGCRVLPEGEDFVLRCDGASPS